MNFIRKTFENKEFFDPCPLSKKVWDEYIIEFNWLDIDWKARNFVNPPYNITDKPLMIEIEAIFAPVKSASKKNKAKMLNGEIKPTKKPDIDNICKSILDGLNKLAYKDDNQVIGLVCRKIYGEVARVKVTISEVN